jgi:hypothetical protein
MHQNWMTFSKCWCKCKLTHKNSTNKHNYSMNIVFANRSKEEEIYPLTVKEIAKAQKLDSLFKATALKEKYEKTLIKNTSVSLQHCAISWYHHYLQHPGNTHLEEAPKAAMYWKHMHSTICSYVKNYQFCQVN